MNASDGGSRSINVILRPLEYVDFVVVDVVIVVVVVNVVVVVTFYLVVVNICYSEAPEGYN